MKSRYWSCSKFADWLRGTPKLSSGTAEEWNAWEKTAKIKKLRYWLAEEALDHLQNFVCWPTNCIRNIYHFIDNRFITKSHAMTSNLERGTWHDFDSRLLHSAFDELVNFVEIEQAWMLAVCSKEDRKKFKTPWYRTVFHVGVWRCPEAGIAYLEWAAGLKHDEDWVDKNDPIFGKPTPQALAAQETLTLFKWWKYERPNRPDPYEVSGWNEYCEENFKEAEAPGDKPLWGNLFKHKTEDERSRTILSICHKIEKEQEEDDTSMLIRLVRIRNNLWT